jgi:chorismate mutase/prephenate dehydratase
MSFDFSTFNGKVAYLGPAGSWTHQASVDLFPFAEKLPFSREELASAYDEGRVDFACLPVTTSLVGVTPYLDHVLAMKNVTIVAEYPKMLGYSLLVRPGTELADVNEVYAHSVAFEEVRPWLERELPGAKQVDTVSGGMAARMVAESTGGDKASLGPKAGAAIYGLQVLVDGIEEGPHNITRWWVLGRTPAAATGHDKTSFLVKLDDAGLTGFLSSVIAAKLQILTIYERPAKSSLDRHHYIIEIAGHRDDLAVAAFLEGSRQTTVLGSYSRQY